MMLQLGVICPAVWFYVAGGIRLLYTILIKKADSHPIGMVYPLGVYKIMSMKPITLL